MFSGAINSLVTKSNPLSRLLQQLQCNVVDRGSSQRMNDVDYDPVCHVRIRLRLHACHQCAICAVASQRNSDDASRAPVCSVTAVMR